MKKLLLIFSVISFLFCTACVDNDDRKPQRQPLTKWGSENGNFEFVIDSKGHGFGKINTSTEQIEVLLAFDFVNRIISVRTLLCRFFGRIFSAR